MSGRHIDKESPDWDLHAHWMSLALDQAREAAALDEVPVGAVLVDSRAQECIGKGFNQTVSRHDPSGHAEIIALRQAGARRQNYRLPGCVLYVTIEPCTMCLGAMIHARVDLLVFGAREPRAGAAISQGRLLNEGYFNHHMDFLEGVLAEDCGGLLQQFFSAKRQR